MEAMTAKLTHSLVSGVDGLVGADGHGQELPGELQDGLVLEDDGATSDASALYSQPVQAVDVVARWNLEKTSELLMKLSIVN